MKIASILLIFLLLLGVNSCCTEMYCLGVEDINIKLQDFSLQELEELTLVNTTQNDTIETFVDIQDEGGFFLQMSSKFNIENNYTLYIDLIGASYSLSNFQTSKDKCNSGFMCRDFVYHLKSYHVNGVKYNAESGYIIAIHK